MFIRDHLEGVGSICMTFAPFSYYEVGDELHIRKVDNAKLGLRHHVAKLSGIETKHCSSEASVDHAADSQQGFD